MKKEATSIDKAEKYLRLPLYLPVDSTEYYRENSENDCLSSPVTIELNTEENVTNKYVVIIDLCR